MGVLKSRGLPYLNQTHLQEASRSQDAWIVGGAVGGWVVEGGVVYVGGSAARQLQPVDAGMVAQDLLFTPTHPSHLWESEYGRCWLSGRKQHY